MPGKAETLSSATSARTKLVDAKGRVRALLVAQGERSTLTFISHSSGKRRVVRGLIPVSRVLLEMLEDPRCHPEIVGTPDRMPSPTHSLD
jgi:hypothetical protein